MERRWSTGTKRIVVLSAAVLLFLALNRLRALLAPLIVAMILAYILNPIVEGLRRLLRIPRTAAAILIYLGLLALIAVGPALLIPPFIAAVQGFAGDFPNLVARFGERLEQPLVVGEFQLDLTTGYQQIQGSLEGLVSTAAQQTVSIVSNVASALLWSIFVLVASFYMVKDAPHLTRWAEEVVPPEVRADYRRLMEQIAATWNAFLRGQLILCVTMGLVVGITMSIIGLPKAWLIGLLFGALEFIPNLGPLIASVPAVLLALFEGSTWLPLSNLWFTVLVIGVNVAIQQLENTILVPRIIGSSLNLHPLVVLIAVLAGSQVAGILGILLAAPIVATLRILVEYVYYRLLDMPPFPEEPEVAEEAVVAESADGQPPTADLAA